MITKLLKDKVCHQDGDFENPQGNIFAFELKKVAYKERQTHTNSHTKPLTRLCVSLDPIGIGCHLKFYMWGKP
jgi:hypothetical protein